MCPKSCGFFIFTLFTTFFLTVLGFNNFNKIEFVFNVLSNNSFNKEIKYFSIFTGSKY